MLSYGTILAVDQLYDVLDFSAVFAKHEKKVLTSTTCSKLL